MNLQSRRICYYKTSTYEDAFKDTLDRWEVFRIIEQAKLLTTHHDDIRWLRSFSEIKKA
jgi:hypothetical protein